MDEFEQQIQQVARQFAYPPTPGLRIQPPARRRSLRLAWAGALLTVLAAVVLIAPLRAAVMEWLRIGVITIGIGEAPTLTPALPTLLNLFGETTMAEAQAAAGFPLRQPADFGPPDRVYQQSADGRAFVLVWLEDPVARRPAISLYQFAADSPAYGKMLSIAANTQVHDAPAIWTDVPHLLQYQGISGVFTQRAFLVEGHVLIWAEAGVTYRLESTLTEAETVAIAESLR
ncbi:MAG: hypothetical protein K8J31_28630 [Anaerolineae bacterium]|nr:hypothetical protein [Anaerolineae bacterium]